MLVIQQSINRSLSIDQGPIESLTRSWSTINLPIDWCRVAVDQILTRCPPAIDLINYNYAELAVRVAICCSVD